MCPLICRIQFQLSSLLFKNIFYITTLKWLMFSMYLALSLKSALPPIYPYRGIIAAPPTVHAALLSAVASAQTAQQ